MSQPNRFKVHEPVNHVDCPQPQAAIHQIPPKTSGLKRWGKACSYSTQGLQCAWEQTAFKEEALLGLILVPLAFYLGKSWAETALLIGAWIAVLVVETLNTAIEKTLNYLSPDWHPLAKQAKDLGSAAVALSLLFGLGVWAAALYQYFLA